MADGSTPRYFAQTAGSHKRHTSLADIPSISVAEEQENRYEEHHCHHGSFERLWRALAARALAVAGHTVYASMRETAGRNAAQVEAAREFATENGVDLRTIELDVASQESADQAIKSIVEQDGCLDAVIHNAGHMVFGAAEAFTPEQLLEVYDTNVLSTQRVNRAALPQLR
jgi:hypothetical protein